MYDDDELTVGEIAEAFGSAVHLYENLWPTRTERTASWSSTATPAR